MSENAVHSRPADFGPFPPELLRVRWLSLLVGLAGVALCILGWLLSPEHFFRSWLFAYLFWLSISLGAMVFVMISHMTGGEWGVIIRRFGEAAARNLPLMLLFFLPLMAGYKYLFPWAHIQTYEQDPDRYHEVIRVLEHRANWFNSLAFTVRSLFYFVVWCSFAFAIISGSHHLDHQDSPVIRRRLRMISAGGVLLYFITITSFGMDFIMSRETHWYSSILGFILAVGQGTAGMAFLTLVVCYFSDRLPIKNILRPSHLIDFGNLLLTLVILWAYTAFAQLLVIWTGNTKPDIGYYTHRGLGVVPNPWRWVALALIIGHFFAPFFLLLMRTLKRKAPTLALIASLLLVMRIVDNLWLTAPSGPNRQRELSGVYWTDLTAWVGMGGIWLFVYLWNLSVAPLLPRNASDQPEIVSHGIDPAHG